VLLAKTIWIGPSYSWADSFLLKHTCSGMGATLFLNGQMRIVVRASKVDGLCIKIIPKWLRFHLP
jgi:hypothetical protein